MKKTITLLLLFFLNCSLFAQTSHLLIVKNHQPNAVIVIPASASAQIQNAAKKLQSYIQQSTNAVLPIETNEPATAISIEIGQTSFVKQKGIDIGNLDEDAFILRTVDPRHLIIVGGSDWGTEYGIYAFLERYVGVHWLMPSDIGTDVPQHATINIPTVKIADSPVYLSRQVSPYYVEWTDIFSVWSRFNRFRGRISVGHNLIHLFDPKEYLSSNPDFYPHINGRLTSLKSDEWQPNFSTTGIADTAAAKIIRYFRKYPTAANYSLGINDWPVFDESTPSLIRRNGKKNYLGRENVSDDYFRWVNDVVNKVLQVFPNKNFGVLAYNSVAEPPSQNIGVAPHVIPFLTYERMRWADSSLKIQGHKLNELWGQDCPTLGWYDYVYGLSYLMPRVWFHEMADYLQWGSANQVKYYYAELYPNWGEGPKPWVLGKLLWNPNYDVDSLLNVWYQSTAGAKAAQKLRAFYQIWEKFWTNDVFKTPWNSNEGQYLFFNNFSYLEYISSDYITRCDLLMKDAYNLAGTDLQKNRVSELMKMWELYKLAVKLYQDPSVPEGQKQSHLAQSPEFIAMLKDLSKDPIHGDSVKWIKGQLKIN